MITQLEPQFGREVVRCDECSLVQFPTQSLRCRRCGVGYGETLPAPPTAAQSPATVTVCVNVGPAIRLVRMAREMSQDELGRRVELNQSNIARIESGEKTLYLDRLSDIARALEIEPGVLVQIAQVQQHGCEA